MAFNFGGSNAAPAAAPATGSFSFGSKPGANSSAGGFSFGTSASSAAVTAPAAGGFSFGASTTPAPAPAPVSSAGGFSFGVTPTPAPAPATASVGFSFGGVPAAPTTPTATTNASTFSFATAPAPAATSVATSSAFSFAPNTVSAGAVGQVPQQRQILSGHTMYKDLPENYRKAIDSIHEHIMKHRRTMQNVNTMVPALLTVTSDSTPSGLNKSSNQRISSSSPADAAAGPSSSRTLSTQRTESTITNSTNVTSLPYQVRILQSQIQTLSSQIEKSIGIAETLENNAKKFTGNAIMHAQWPLENLAVRRNVATPFRKPYEHSKNKKMGTNTNTTGGVGGGTDAASLNSQHDLVQKVARMLDMQATQVDRIEKIPNPYIWEQLHFFHQNLLHLKQNIHALKDQLEISNSSLSSSSPKNLGSAEEIAQIIRSQHDAFIRIAGTFSNVHDRLDALKVTFLNMHQAKSSYYSSGIYVDPFMAADVREAEEERNIREKIQAKVAAVAAASASSTGASAAIAPTATSGSFAAAPSPAPGSLFGTAPVPTPVSGSLFGSTPVPPSSGGGLFGVTPAPAPATGGLFGSTPAPAPAVGSLFGSTTTSAPVPAPATGGLFGTAPTAAPAAGGLFGSTASAPTTSQFGAPAPAPAGLARAPAAGIFGAPSSAPTFGSSKSKNKSRSGRSRR